MVQAFRVSAFSCVRSVLVGLSALTSSFAVAQSVGQSVSHPRQMDVGVGRSPEIRALSNALVIEGLVEGSLDPEDLRARLKRIDDDALLIELGGDDSTIMVIPGSNQISRSRLLRDLDLTDLVDDDRAKVREWRFRRKQWFEQSVDSGGATTLINAARPPGAQPVISLSYTESCASAAMSYRGMRDVLDLRRALRSWSVDASALTEQYKAAFEYEKECLAPILAPDYPDTMPAWLRARSPDRVLGVFEFRDRDSATDGPFCTGLLVGPSTVVTARHCFYKENGRRRDLFDALRRDEIGFRRAAPPYELLSLVPDPIAIADATLTKEFSMVIAGRVSQIDGPLDIVAFKLASPLSDVPSLRFDAPGWNRRSVLFGPFAAVERGNPDTRDVPGSIKAIRWDRGAHCATANSASGCVRHTCQAFQTYSGAPLFGEPRAHDPEGLVIIGMHIATDDSRPGCMDVESVRAFGTGNLAMDGKRIEQFVQALQPSN